MTARVKRDLSSEWNGLDAVDGQRTKRDPFNSVVWYAYISNGTRFLSLGRPLVSFHSFVS